MQLLFSHWKTRYVFVLLCLFITMPVFAADPVSPKSDKKTPPGSKNTSKTAPDSVSAPSKQAIIPSAVEWYLEMAELGDRDAQYNLASIYETGFGVEVNYKEAVKWYAKAAKQGHAVAQIKLGMMHYLGLGTKVSIIRGKKWIREAVDNGNPVAKLLQTKVLAHNAETDIDPKKLIAKARAAYDKGEINAEETLRLELQKIERKRKQEEPKQRFAGKVTGSGAKPGTVKNNVPAFLENKTTTKVNTGDSLVMVRRRAQSGVPEAQYELARFYETGNKVEKDLGEAFRWYSSAANKSHKDAQYRLALAYLYGLGVNQSVAQAGMWLKKASGQQQNEAKFLLAYSTSIRGGAVDKDNSMLLSWYIERAVDGEGDAMMGLGYMFENGWGVSPNIKEAKQWYRKARAAGTRGAAKRFRGMKSKDLPPKQDPEDKFVPRKPTSAQMEQVSQTPQKTDRIQTEKLDQKQVLATAQSPQAIDTGSSPKSNETERFVVRQPRQGQNRQTQQNPQAVQGGSRSPFQHPQAESETTESFLNIDRMKETVTPVFLLIVGLILGGAVFRVMRRFG